MLLKKQAGLPAHQRYRLRLALFAVLLTMASLAGRTVGASTPALQVNTAHPRLWLTAPDVTRLRSWAVSSNVLFADGLLPVAERAKQDMDAGNVPQKDCGARAAYAEYPTEAYAELFAFMSLIDPDEAARASAAF